MPAAPDISADGLAPGTSAAAAVATSTGAGHRRLARFAWGVLAYNLLVIAWGVFVRASGSGAGCGAHWPLCNGEGIPELKSRATVIEMTHRTTSGIALVLVFVLLVWTLLRVKKTDPAARARRAAVLTGVFMMGEALIGAALVLLELVAHNTSLKRGLSMILHLGNTFLLLAALTITAWTLTVDPRPTASPRAAPRGVRLAIFTALGAVLFLGSSGAIAALGDTLFPAASLRAGLAQDFSPLAHVFLRLRMFHPFIALGTGALVLGAAALVRSAQPQGRSATLSRFVTLAFVAQFMVGLLNLSLLAPIPMQIIHLLLADALWMALVLMGWEALYGAPVRRPSPAAIGTMSSSTAPPASSIVA